MLELPRADAKDAPALVVLGRLALEVAELVGAAAWDRGAPPHLANRAAEAGVAIDDAEHSGAQPAGGEVVEGTPSMPRTVGGAACDLWRWSIGLRRVFRLTRVIQR